MPEDREQPPVPQDDPYGLAPQEKASVPLSAVQKAELELRRKGTGLAKVKVEKPAGLRAIDEGGMGSSALPLDGPAVKWKCTICNYEMLGKPRRGTCPECSAPVNPRATGLLQYATPSWISYVASGCLLLFTGVLLHVVAVVVGQTWDMARAGAGLQVLASILELAGIWVVTTREAHPESMQSSFAGAARMIGVLSFIAYMGMVVMTWKNPEWTAMESPMRQMVSVILFVSAGEAFCVGFHLRHLAMRMPSDALASHTLNLSWIIALACLFLSIMTVTNGISAFYNQELGRMFMVSFPIVFGLGAVAVWACWILLRMFTNLRDCAIAAATPPRKRVQVRPGVASSVGEIPAQSSKPEQ